MATRLYFIRDGATAQHWGGSEAGLSESTREEDFITDPRDLSPLADAGGWSSLKLDTIRGVSSHNSTRTSIEGPHDGIELITMPTEGLDATFGGWNSDDTRGWMQWFTEAIDVGGTINSGATIPVNLWGSQPSLSAHAAINVILHKFSHVDGSTTLIGQSNNTTALGTTGSAHSFNITAAATVVLEKGDRIRARVYFAETGTAGTTVGAYQSTSTIYALAGGGALTGTAPGPTSVFGDYLVCQAWIRGANATLAKPQGWTELGTVATATARHYFWGKLHKYNDGTNAAINVGNEKQTITLSDYGVGGAFTVTFGGQTTGLMNFGTTAAQMQTALGNLSTIGAGNVSVFKTVGVGNTPPFVWEVEFVGALAATNVAEMTASETYTDATTVTVATIQEGSAANGDRYAMITNFRGTPGLEAVGTPASGTTAALSVPGVTTTQNNCLIVCMTNGEDNNAASVAYTATSPATLTANNYQESAIGTDGALAIGSAEKTAAGATGNVTATWNNLPVANAGIVLALKPDLGNVMSPGHRLVFNYNGPTSLAAGDSWFEIPIDIFFLDPLQTTNTIWFPLSQFTTGGTSNRPGGGHVMREVVPGEPGRTESTVSDPAPTEGPLDGFDLGDSIWYSNVLTADFMLTGYVRVKFNTQDTLALWTMGMHAEMSYWNGTDYTVWAASQQSPKHSWGRKSAQGFFTNSVWTDLIWSSWCFLAGPDTTVPEGSHLRLRILGDDGHKDLRRYMPPTGSSPNAGPAFMFARFNNATFGTTYPQSSRIEWTNPLYVPALDQARLRGRNDDGSETTATWKAATNVGWEQPYDENFRVRISIDEVGNADPDATGYKLQAKWGGVNYVDVTPTSSVVRVAASPHVADGTATTVQLGPPLDGGVFVPGEFDDVDAAVASNDIALAGHTEHEWCLTIPSTGDVVPGSEVRIRAVKPDGTPLTRYGGNPIITTPAAGEDVPVKWQAHVRRRR